jgi:hypothetical protein
LDQEGKQMKKGIAILSVIWILFFSIASASAAAGSTKLTLRPSAGTIRVGDTITITGSFEGSTVIGVFDVAVSYNPAVLEYRSSEGITPAIQSGELDIVPKAGSIQLLYLDSDGGVSGIKAGNAFRCTFKVIGGKASDPVVVDALFATVGNADAQPMTSSVSKATMSIGAPLSGNALLGGLTIGNAVLSPAFDKNTTTYTTSVPFDTSRLTIDATPEDAKAKVVVSGNELVADAVTTVAVTVTAENGVKKVYSIAVAREADPNYKPSTNAQVKTIDVENFLLSPPFDPDTTSYVIWLPYETTAVRVEGVAQEGKATIAVTGGENLAEGKDNPIKIVCTAEDGTTKEYTIIAKRASALAQTSSPESSDVQSAAPSSSGNVSNPESNVVQRSAAIVLAVACLATGLIAGFLTGRRRKL